MTQHDTPATVVIFGASGDLTKRKLVPALFMLKREGHLPSRFSLVGVARREKTDEEFRGDMGEAVSSFSRAGSPDRAQLDEFLSRTFYVCGDFANVETYKWLKTKLDEVESAAGVKDPVRLYYLAIPPSEFPVVLEHLAAAGLSPRDQADRIRIVIEKPFGHDAESGRVLNAQVHRTFEEKQVYRIDHYLGKETVQNILVFRLANGIFEPLWNRRYIDHVQITVAETLGVEGRGGYFDEAGILRDIVQNHMLQLLCLVGMEPPIRFDAEQVRNEKVKVLMALRPFGAEDLANSIVRGQYVGGDIAGARVPAYRDEPSVDPHSNTDTYVAFRVFLDNWRWAGVPFYLRAGKRLAGRTTSIAIHFRRPPLTLFRQARAPEPNLLLLQIQPDEGIWLRVGSKRPGGRVEIDPVELQFRYSTTFDQGPPEAYERLLLDAMHGDSTLFAREDEVDYAWRVVTPMLEHWKANPGVPVTLYPAGSWGPLEGDRLIQADGRAWYNEIPGRD
ncbi:MAG: glucose-6-phosphate dehydrogenase [Candidatus Eisenbacteria bacterium]|nr:glucose-6-phosphate dehydrogenase [Candidatus Eisenbacteria bacterium]MCC7143217.1 glucose-6-phosphate dehydrogenase [Candidatus Eisenbacteria bacterium]